MTVLYSVEGGIATLTLNRPEVRNALNGAMCEALRAASLRAADDAAVRLVIVRATGPVFCAGADIKERAGMETDQVRSRGLQAFAACDFILATPDALFSTPEAPLRGTVGATQRLPRVLGKRLAKDLMFTGRRLTAQEAVAAGLVSRIAENLVAEIDKIAKAILAAPPQALREAKRCIDRGVELDPRGALALELAAIEAQLASGKWMGKA